MLVQVSAVADRTPLTGSAAGLSITSDLARLSGLSTGELVAALCASDMPLTGQARDLAPDEAAHFVLQGLARLGERMAWWLSYRARKLAGRSGYSRLWPSACRRDRAVAVAGHLTGHLQRSGLWKAPETVELPYFSAPDGSAEFFIRVDARDFRLRDLYGEPPADLAWPSELLRHAC